MKKTTLLFAILLLLATLPTLGQSKYQPQWYVGVGGAGLTTFVIQPSYYGEPGLDSKLTFSYAGNLNVGVDYNKHWGFKLEGGYAALGQKFDGTQYGLTASRTLKLDYVTVAFVMKYRVGSEKVKFFVEAGPQLGFVLSAKQDYTREGVDASYIYDVPLWGKVEVFKDDISDRLTGANGFVRADFGLELTPTEHFMINFGVTSAYSITDLNQHDWRMNNIDKEYKISHNAYAGLNLGLSYRW